MNRKEAYSVLINSFRGTVLFNEPMAKHTSYRIGGPVDLFVEPKDPADLQIVLQFLKENETPGIVVGKGSNLLVSDQGFQGIIIRLNRFGHEVRFDGNQVYASAGLSLTKLVAAVETVGLGGIEFLDGIPGTVGGAIKMNAGAFGGEIGDRVMSVDVMTSGGAIQRREKDQLFFHYRDVKGLDDGVILSCCLLLDRSSSDLIADERKRLRARRKALQPMGLPSCGSVFKRLPGTASPGELIEKAGCKGLSVGGAVISEKHANFILNYGEATAQDVWSLIKETRQRVHECFGVELLLEVKLVGCFD